jgi:RNA polymerase sigma-70 factor (ECF subfamily)
VDVALEAVEPAADLETLYREHGGRLWRSLYAYSGDRDIASDATAEAFAQALSRGPGLRQPLGWIWKAAFRIAAGALKERGRHTHRLPDQPIAPPDGPTATVLALARLHDGQRAAIVLHYYADLPVREVARLMGTSVPAVKMHLLRGRRALRGALEIDDV